MTGRSEILKDKKTFVICVFNRATYGRCQALIEEIAKTEHIKLKVIISSGLLMKEFGGHEYIKSKTESVEIVQIPIEYETTHLGSVQATSQIQARLGEYFNSLAADKLDAVLVVGDRFETLGAAIAASYLNIPLVHLQGGEITGNIDEKVRHAVTKLADYHFVTTTNAKKYLYLMGEEHFRVFHTGCPSLDVIKNNEIHRGTKSKYIICQFHPVTTEGDLKQQTEILLESVTEFCIKNRLSCYWYWPNPDPNRTDVVETIEAYYKEYSCLLKAPNIEPVRFLELLAKARFIIGNSSCGIRESSFLGVPAINVGNRQSIRERSWNVIDTDVNREELIAAMAEQYKTKRYKRSYLFGDGNSSINIVTLLTTIDFSIKGPLTYPNHPTNNDLHYGEARFAKHKIRVNNSAHQRFHLQSESLGSRSKRSKATSRIRRYAYSNRQGDKDSGT